MLETRFPRLPGDIGSPASFSGPVIHQMVKDAKVDQIVRAEGVNPLLAARFVQAVKELEEQGVRVVGTSCGFLSVLQSQIQSALNIPFLSSSLLHLPTLINQYGAAAKIGVLTFDAGKLTDQHIPLPISEIKRHVTVHGLNKTSHLYQTIAEDRLELDRELARGSVMELLDSLLKTSPDVDAIILECTNLSPWKSEMRQRTGVPVFDLVDLIAFYLNGMN